ncbi:unnamed protein product [Cercopithifilaria johnstoni]|uniref:Uncharacterized protein n=1 Tax=Cercopithifilaria johnstoni TaxID=2874296 RepID=A0A8J2MK82_9BILA|nr:unnamed protein product [Cercopithifilaria johnstoni]
MNIYNNNEQEMMPRRQKNFGTPRIMTSMKNNHFDSPFRSPYDSATFPRYATMSSPHSSFRHKSPYQHRKRPYCHPPAPLYSVNSLTSTQHPPNWHSPSRTSLPCIYKNPQNMIQGHGSCAISSGNRRHNHKDSRTVCLAEQFDVNDYVIPAMTSNPWSKLEEFYANRRLDEQ